MSYQVFARKYRPNIFNDLIGQPHIKETLSNAITTNRLAHAYLFAGSRGTGKTTTARILAKCLNCDLGITITPCGQCSSCQEIAGGYSMDVMEIDGASNRGIDEIRELRERVKFMPAKARYKVYIIDEVHMLTNEAFNALLKTLEEPPAHVIFAFATTEPHKVPQTILSRCQRFDFKRISISEICQVLKKVASLEKIEIDDLTLTFIARSAEGSMRDAESILDQVVSFCGNNVTCEDVLAILGIIKQGILLDFCEAIIKSDSNKIIKLLNDLVDEGIDLGQFVREMMMHLRNLLLIKTGCPPDSVIDLTSDSIKLLEAQSLSFTYERLLSMIEEFQKINEKMRLFPLQAKLILEVALIKIVQGDKNYVATKTEELKEKVNHPQSGGLKQEEGSREKEFKEEVRPPHPQVVLSVTKQASEQQTEELENRTEEQTNKVIHISENLGFSIQQAKELWPQLRRVVKKEKPSLDTCLAAGEIIEASDHILTLGFREGDTFHKARVEIRENKELIEGKIKEILNYEVRIKTITKQSSFIDGESSAQKAGFIEETAARQASARQASARQASSETMVLDRVLKVFPEAEIIA
ncbi:MAG: DNA polymerase III subunit gamma/tau [bacterium]|nr:DNA polymerase III subunit gamma/tau [bacterium]